jgi:muramoyltetrapeptide carboxypeptidase
VDGHRLDKGLAVVERALTDGQLVAAPELHERFGYLAGDDEQRLGSVQRALADPDAQAIWCARGGYGTTRILKRLDASGLRDNPKTLVGFSDVTALLCWAWVSAGVPGVHGPVVTQCATLEPGDPEAVVEFLRGEVPAPLAADHGEVIAGGSVEGPLIVGNLEVLRSLIGTPFLPSLEGAILGIEEVGERPYRIDRALTHLRSSGALRGVRGVIVGQLKGCREPDDGASHGWSAPEVISERLTPLGVPVVTGFPFGHDHRRNAPLPFGVRVRLQADDATIVFLEPVMEST